MCDYFTAAGKIERKQTSRHKSGIQKLVLNHGNTGSHKSKEIGSDFSTRSREEVRTAGWMEVGSWPRQTHLASEGSVAGTEHYLRILILSYRSTPPARQQQMEQRQRSMPVAFKKGIFQFWSTPPRINLVRLEFTARPSPILNSPFLPAWWSRINKSEQSERDACILFVQTSAEL